jgi:hypothetical protein
MPAAKGKIAEVRPIYRTGDRVLVELPSGFHVLVIQASEVVAGELWFDGESSKFGTSFPARSIVRRLAPGEVFNWRTLK